MDDEKGKATAEQSPLQRVQEAADRWVTLLSTLLSISTILGLVQGRDVFSKLALGTQIAVAGAFIAALGMFILAITAGTEASLGKPALDDSRLVQIWAHFQNRFQALMRKTPQNSEKNPENREYEKALETLRRSRHRAVKAIICLAIGILIASFGPGQQTSSTTSIIALEKTGMVVCGTLSRDTTGHLLLTTNTQIIILNDVISLNIVSNCP